MELFPAGDGDVYLLRAGGEPAAVVRRPADEDRDLLTRLAEGGVAAAEGSEVAGRLAPLLRAGLLIPDYDEAALPPDLAERFSRQLPWMAEHGDPVAAQLALRDAHVVVLGCGGVGTWALGAIACLGVGRFTVVDDDTVEISNLNRQILYRAGDVGRPKADRAAEWLREFDPGIDVTVVRERMRSPSDLARALVGGQVLVLAADWPAYALGRWVNEVCVAAGMPFVVAGQQPPVLKVGPAYVPGRSACFACHERRLAADHPFYLELTEHRRRDPAPATTLGPAAGVLGTLLALDVLALLTTDSPAATEGRAMLLDMRTLEQRWETVERDPSCPVCADAG